MWESVLRCRGEMKGNAGKCWGKVWKSVLGYGGRGRCRGVWGSVRGGVRKCVGVWGR